MAQTAELKDVQRQITATEVRARELMAGVSQEQLWTRPSPQSWSIGECLAHLNIVGQLYLQQGMEGAVTAGWAAGKVGSGPFRYSLMFRLFMWYEEPPPRKKFIPFKLGNASPELFAPPAQPNEQVFEEFMALQAELLALSERADGLDLNGIRLSSPAAERFRMSLLEAFGGTLAHQRRHLWQAERAKETIQTQTLPDGPPASGD